ncbi:MAG: hypothetical protein WAT92_15420 [Saprospiraceae bacterium]
MYHAVQVIESVDYFYLGEIFIIKKGKEIYLNGKKESIDYANYISKGIIQYSVNDSYFLQFLDENFYKRIPGLLNSFGTQKEFYFYITNTFFERSSGKILYSLNIYNILNEESFKIFENVSINILDYSQNHSLLFYYNLNNTIAAFNIEKKETIWETNIMNILGVSKSEKIEALHLTKVFGILKENLWLSFEFHYIIGLSIIDGEILFSFNINDLLPPENKYRWLFPHFDEDAGTISYCESNAYFVLDLKTLKVIDFHSFIIPDKSNQWTIVSCTMDDNFVYFNGNLGGSFFSPSAVGIFDRHKKEVVWYEDLKLYEQDQYRFINHPPQYGGGKLYVHDSKGTLYIYEREDL